MGRHCGCAPSSLSTLIKQWVKAHRRTRKMTAIRWQEAAVRLKPSWPSWRRSRCLGGGLVEAAAEPRPTRHPPGDATKPASLGRGMGASFSSGGRQGTSESTLVMEAPPSGWFSWFWWSPRASGARQLSPVGPDSIYGPTEGQTEEQVGGRRRRSRTRRSRRSRRLRRAATQKNRKQ